MQLITFHSLTSHWTIAVKVSISIQLVQFSSTGVYSQKGQKSNYATNKNDEKIKPMAYDVLPREEYETSISTAGNE